jgi:hypothetical protein
MNSGLLWFLAFGAVAVAWWIQFHRLFWQFRSKYPEIARSEIPLAFEAVRRPEKALFFLRQRSADLLRNDPSLWNLRQQVKALTIIVFIVFPLSFAAFVVGAMLVSQ